MEDKDKKIAAAALLIFAGGVIGAGMALLFAPQSGSRTRKDIYRYSKRTRNRAEEVVDDLAANVSDLVDTIGEKTDDLLEKGKGVAGWVGREWVLGEESSRGRAKLKKGTVGERGQARATGWRGVVPLASPPLTAETPRVAARS